MNELKDGKTKPEILADYLAQQEYDNIIYHSEIAKIIDVKQGTSKYGTTISKAKLILNEKYHKALESVHAQGYRLVSPSDYTIYSLGYYKRGMNSMSRGKQYIDNAPTSEMSQEELASHRQVADRVNRLNASMAEVAVEVKELARKPHPFIYAQS